MKRISELNDILLTDQESAVFRKVRKNPGVVLAAEESRPLYLLDLISPETEGLDSFGVPVRTDRWHLSRDGERYLLYLEKQKAAVRKEHWHDWLIAVFSALFGALLSQPLWALLHQLAVRI